MLLKKLTFIIFNDFNLKITGPYSSTNYYIKGIFHNTLSKNIKQPEWQKEKIYTATINKQLRFTHVYY